MTLTVHHLENSRSQRVLWLLEELGLPYEIKHYARDKKTSLAPPELAAVHPLGKSPVLSDGEVIVAETGAIVEYLLDRVGGTALRPAPGTPERLRFTYWLHFAEGSAMPPLVMALIFNKVRNARMPFFAKPIAKSIANKVMTGFVQPNIDRQLAFMESRTGDATLVRRRSVQCRRHHDELSARSRRHAQRADRALPQAHRLPGPHPRPAGVPARAGTRWTLCAAGLSEGRFTLQALSQTAARRSTAAAPMPRTRRPDAGLQRPPRTTPFAGRRGRRRRP